MTEQKEWPTLGYSVKGNRFAIVADLCDVDENYKADQIIELVDRSALAARDARIAELEGLLSSIQSNVLDGMNSSALHAYGTLSLIHSRIDAALAVPAGQPQQDEPEWPKEQCPVTGAIRDVDPAELPARQVGGDEREAQCSVKDCLRWSGADTDYHGKLLFTVGQFERFVDLVSKRAVARAALAAAIQPTTEGSTDE